MTKLKWNDYSQTRNPSVAQGAQCVKERKVLPARRAHSDRKWVDYSNSKSFVKKRPNSNEYNMLRQVLSSHADAEEKDMMSEQGDLYKYESKWTDYSEHFVHDISSFLSSSSPPSPTSSPYYTPSYSFFGDNTPYASSYATSFMLASYAHYPSSSPDLSPTSSPSSPPSPPFSLSSSSVILPSSFTPVPTISIQLSSSTSSLPPPHITTHACNTASPPPSTALSHPPPPSTLSHPPSTYEDILTHALSPPPATHTPLSMEPLFMMDLPYGHMLADGSLYYSQ